MKNKYGIPEKELDKIKERDFVCAYCQQIMLWDVSHDKNSATIENLNHRQDWNSVESYVRRGLPVDEIIVICCRSCNSSRGAKKIIDWFDSKYCLEKNICIDTVVPTVKNYILKFEYD